MIEDLILSTEQCQRITGWSDAFITRLQGLTQAVQRVVSRSRAPKEISDLQTKASALHNLIAPTTQFGRPFPLPGQHLSVLKLVVREERLHEARIIDDERQHTHNLRMLAHLDERLRPFDEMIAALHDVKTERMPRITDFVTVEKAEELFAKRKLSDRVYHPKFKILLSPDLFLPDLDYFRERCGWRDTSVCIAYIDIDGFKAYNTRFNETEVDRRILPPFGRLLEAHVYQHGFAYQEGGDEYLLVLPNTSADKAVTLVHEFQTKLVALPIEGVEPGKFTVSCGVFEITPNSVLTNREAKALADVAKNHAKGGGKDCVSVINTRRECGEVRRRALEPS